MLLKDLTLTNFIQQTLRSC